MSLPLDYRDVRRRTLPEAPRCDLVRIDLAEVEWITRVSQVISVRTVVGLLGAWAEASQAGALANARAASVVCSRARLERAEVEAYLAERLAPTADLGAREEAASR